MVDNSPIKAEANTLEKILVVNFADISVQNETQISFKHPVREQIASLLLSEKLVLDWSKTELPQIPLQLKKQVKSIPDMLLAELRYHIEIIETCVQSVLIDTKLYPVLYRLNSMLLAFALLDESFWTQPRPLKQYINELLLRMMVWTADFPQASPKLLDIFTDVVNRLAVLDTSDVAVKAFAQNTLQEIDQITEKFDRLAQRQKQAEIGQIKAQHFTDVVALFLNQTFKDKRLPSNIADFLKTQWLNEMRIYLIKQGDDSPEWMRWRKMITTLVQYYQTDVQIKEDAFHRNILLNFTDELQALIKETQMNAGLFDNFCNTLAFDFAQISSGIVLTHLAEVEPIELFKTQADIEKKISSSLLHHANQYEEGQWFVYQDDAMQSQRAKLLITLPEFDYLLFVNLVGQKSLIIHFEQFAYLLSAKRIAPLKQHNYFYVGYKFMLGRLLKNLDERYQAKHSLIKQEQANEQEILLLNEKAKAAEKAQIEAKRLKVLEQEKQEQKALEQVADDTRRQARLILNSLALGAWVNIEDTETQQMRQAKLAVKYSATGRFVFVDVDGAVVVDCQRDELVELFLLNKMSLLENEGQFADRLASLIKNIRKV